MKKSAIYFIFEYLKSLNYTIFLNFLLKFQFLTNFLQNWVYKDKFRYPSHGNKKSYKCCLKDKKYPSGKSKYLKIRPLMIIQPFIILDVRMTFTCVWYDLTMSYINSWLIPTIIGILVPLLIFLNSAKTK